MAAIFTVACVELVEPAARPALFTGTLTIVATTEGDSLSFQATFDPGVDEAGASPIVANDVMVMAGARVAPIATTSPIREYRAALALPATAQSSGFIHMAWPTLAGNGTRGVDSIPFVRRSGNPRRHLAPGDDVVLNMAPPVGTRLADIGVFAWRADVTSVTGFSLSLSQTGPLPSIVTIPAEVLPRALADTLDVTLAILQRDVVPSIGGEYAVELQVNTRITWRVTTGPQP